MKKLVILLVGIVFALPSYVQAKSCNVIIHASKSLKTTKDEVRKYKHFDNVTILKNNGWYLVSVAKLNKQQSNGVLRKWKAQGKIPQDSFCSAARYRTVNFDSSNKKATPKALGAAKKINKKMVPAAKPVMPKTKQVKPQKVTPKNVKNNTQPLSPDHALVLDFNKNIKQYQTNKLNLINFYNKANNSLAVTLQSPTQANLSQHKKLVKSLLFAERALVESYKVIVSKYQANADRFSKIKGVEQIPNFLKNERNNIDIISKKILEMNQRLCQSKSISCK
ncbi:hypothetical protein QJU89_07165 [Pasteurella skyensis]|uniref:SH3 domain-containing protein n=1 Tax=Phocoenobacter skyensis TaxID=97481 RepID=A0AAJ6N9Q0_9PAST|nr:hypothetical protein [Pasteurella skyensis]MDP8162601.1 hypothetical protein [Pasteurella skyensis]MDP8172801.1 hypothetical protein [Pasteurella skyensis]MDP8177355.1 hypothetical protein [Pasteurella skyensis]MDP8179282.1 hypothetical protein [Pasteurella skyensis]MDP8183471.1 hypothetical protein [Pasteurella skyensis]